jgi:hypothetical protein
VDFDLFPLPKLPQGCNDLGRDALGLKGGLALGIEVESDGPCLRSLP